MPESHVVQIIDEHKRFNEHTAKYLSDEGVIGAGLGYHLVSVFGSQSTGKSTLLNALFGTSFGVMSEAQRGQTTHGIWLGHANPQLLAKGPRLSPNNPSPLLVLDVEGTDGRERGEDQDFERKAALFALATSEVLIVNMWEHQVGLYQGANMGLLKTVFEVNLSLFQVSGKVPRSRILFVIRDHVGATPLSNLSATLLTDLEKHWSSIAKPSPDLEQSQIHDFFDISFTALPHKLLMPEKFANDVKALQTRFIDKSDPDYVFDSAYHRRLPLDGWPLYAEQVWQQIELNKDLDLPTQQILVARFRCQEIADVAWKEFTESVTALGLPLGTSAVIPGFGAILRPLRTAVLEAFDSQAAKYDPKVYAAQRLDLLGKVDALLSAHYRSHLAALHDQATTKFRSSVKNSVANGIAFPIASTEMLRATVDEYSRAASEATLDSTCYSFNPELEALQQALDAEAKALRKEELLQIAQKLSKTLSKTLDDGLSEIFAHPDGNTWQKVQDLVSSATDTALRPYAGGKDFGIGASPEENLEACESVVTIAWDILEKKLADMVRREVVADRLRDSFDKNFQYDADGLPIVWKAGDDIDAKFLAAKDSTLAIIPVLSAAKLPSGTVLKRPKSSNQKRVTADSEFDFERLIGAHDLEAIKSRFSRDADLAFLSAKRSITQSATHIPLYFWAVLVLLGWNEFMAILRNPLLVVLILLMAGGSYVLYSLNLLQPTLSVAEATFVRTREVAKEKLREYLLEEGDRRSSSDDIELKPLNLAGTPETTAGERKVADGPVKPSSVSAQSPSGSTARLRRPSDDMLDGNPRKLGSHQRRETMIAATPLPENHAVLGHPVNTQQERAKIPTVQRKVKLDDNVIL